VYDQALALQPALLAAREAGLVGAPRLLGSLTVPQHPSAKALATPARQYTYNQHHA
jgi:hypothetical protein